MEHHVFLSYSRKDTEIMQRIRDDLRAEGMMVWTDDFLTPGTESWKDAIATAIRGSGSLVVVLSPDAEKSPWVKREIDFAHAQKVRVFPLLARGDDSNAIPFVLIDAQYVDVRTVYDANFRKLLDALCDYLHVESNSQRVARLAREKAERLLVEREAREREEREQRRKEAVLQQALAEQRQKTESERLQREREQERQAEETRRRAQALEDKRRENEAERLRTEHATRQLPVSAASSPMPSTTVASIPAIRLSSWNPVDQARLLWWIFITPRKFVNYKHGEGDLVVWKTGTWLASTLTWLPFFVPALAGTVGLLRIPSTASLPWLGVVGSSWLLTCMFGERENRTAGIIAFFAATGVGIVVTIGVFTNIAGVEGRDIWVASPVILVALVVAASVANVAAGVTAGIAASGVVTGMAIVTIGGLFSALIGLFYPFGYVQHDFMLVILAAILVVTVTVAAFAVSRIVPRIAGVLLRNTDSTLPSKLVFTALIFSYAALIWIYWLGGWRILNPA